MDGSPRIVYLDSQIGEQCMQNANDITITTPAPMTTQAKG